MCEGALACAFVCAFVCVCACGFVHVGLCCKTLLKRLRRGVAAAIVQSFCMHVCACVRMYVCLRVSAMCVCVCVSCHVRMSSWTRTRGLVVSFPRLLEATKEFQSRWRAVSFTSSLRTSSLFSRVLSRSASAVPLRARGAPATLRTTGWITRCSRCNGWVPSGSPSRSTSSR